MSGLLQLALLGGAALSAGALALTLLHRAPRAALAGWLAVVCGVPVWVGVTLVVEFEPHVLASAGLVACLVPGVVAGRGLGAGRVTAADGALAFFLAAALVGAVTGRSTVSDVFLLVVQWSGAYLAGRLVGHRVPLRWVYGAVAVALTVVAGIALVEFVSGWNPFVGIPGSGRLHEDWAPIQERGGRTRAEAAFGHSIALGASLALAVPLALACGLRASVRVAMAVVLVAASAVTFSRIGLFTAVAGVALSVVFVRSGLSARLRWSVVGGLAVAAAALSPLVAGTFDAAGDEATASAGYRVDLLGLLPTLQPFGWADSLYVSPTGRRTFAGFDSIDSALLLVGLDYGWVPMVVVVVLLLGALWCLASGRATAPTVAVVAQIPALATVALITQYSTLFWFVAGLAVFSQAAARVPAGAGPVDEDPSEMVNGLERRPFSALR
ncbi:hypothetical protein [Geodermatophilus pulveris]|uniref:hypothetical protein n=1 Tax=Geodermatophilus pulveris TaxID=1564159 RepID=UPI000B786AF6|nr:hypothetical protein [Geodermatophilus pulveris]